MNNIFETFKPINPLISEYVDYYYLDIKPYNIKTEFECFPHYNTTISLYKSNISSKKGEVIFENKAKPLQIFTPIRENILQVKQLGKVHRIVIVFKPLGIQQFYKNLNFNEFIRDHNFFSNLELSKLFSNIDTDIITKLLDKYLVEKHKEYQNIILEKSISLIFSDFGSLPIQEIATKIKISRRHLNRLFNIHFGVTVKKFNDIVLFRKTLEKKLFENTEQSFTDLAYEFNYCDQSHLNKAFQNFTSNSPKSFLKKGTHLGSEDTFWHFKK
jgi:AraC-like DNA-binding protein